MLLGSHVRLSAVGEIHTSFVAASHIGRVRMVMHVVGRVGGVGVDVVRHGADLPLLHDLRIAHAKVSNKLVFFFSFLWLI